MRGESSLVLGYRTTGRLCEYYWNEVLKSYSLRGAVIFSPRRSLTPIATNAVERALPALIVWSTSRGHSINRIRYGMLFLFDIVGEYGVGISDRWLT